MLQRCFIALLIVSLICSCASRKGMPVAESIALETATQIRGQQVFMDKCQKCHPGGASGLAPALNNKPLPGFMIKLQVRHGLGVMPSFDKEVISKEELDYLTDYLKALRK